MDQPFLERHPNKRRRHRLGQRTRVPAGFRRDATLIGLERDLPVLHHQQAGHAVGGQIVVQVEHTPLILDAQCGHAAGSQREIAHALAARHGVGRKPAGVAGQRQRKFVGKQGAVVEPHQMRLQGGRHGHGRFQI
ncbi:hypothetical protein D3C87_1734050 [compost metagenome]